MDMSFRRVVRTQVTYVSTWHSPGHITERTRSPSPALQPSVRSCCLSYPLTWFVPLWPFLLFILCLALNTQFTDSILYSPCFVHKV